MPNCEHAGTCRLLIAERDRAIIAETKCHAAREFLAFPGRDGGPIPTQLEAARRFHDEQGRVVPKCRKCRDSGWAPAPGFPLGTMMLCDCPAGEQL